MKFGYIRETKNEPTLTMQLEAIQTYGVDEIYEEWSSKYSARESQLSELLDQLRAGDELIVWRLDRLGRTIKQLVTLAEDFEGRGIRFVSIKEKVDSFYGTEIHLIKFLCMLGSMEREVLGERVAIGKHISQESGKRSGRKRLEDARVKKALSMYYANQYTIEEIINASGLSKTSIYKYLREDSDNKRGE